MTNTKLKTIKYMTYDQIHSLNIISLNSGNIECFFFHSFLIDLIIIVFH